MSDKFKRGRKGTERFFKKHGKGYRKNGGFGHNHIMREREPSRYDPDARYS